MKQRGRKSAAAAAVAAEIWDKRPAPPDDLTDSEKELWRSICATKSNDWFDAGSLPLLREYVRLNTDVEILNGRIDQFEPEHISDSEGIRIYEKLIGMRDKVHARLVQYAMKMRLTQQARYHPEVAATRSRAKAQQKPWEGS